MFINSVKFDPLYLVVTALLAFHIALGLQTINSLSPTYDEPVHITAGYSYWKSPDYRLNIIDHPPFAKMLAGFPLVFMNPSLPVHHPYWQQIRKYQYPFSDLFLYRNRVDAEILLNWGRRMILLLSALLGIFIFIWARKLYGPGSGIFALFLWCFAPFFVANGTLVTTDMALTLFYFTSFYFLWLWLSKEKSGPKAEKVKISGFDSRVWIPLGLSIGLLLSSKYSAFVFFLPAAAIIFYYYKIREMNPGKILRVLALSLLIAVGVLMIVYRFNSLTGYYMLGLKKVIGGVATGRSSFFMGKYSTSGWLLYFPAAFMLKTPLPLLCFLGFSIFLKTQRTREKFFFLLLPALFYFALGCISKMQIGHRHILPVYPFLIVWASGIYPAIRQNALKYAVFVLLLWYAAGTLKNHPWHLSYFNELAGNPDNGYKYFTDSNLDWGQGIKALGAYLKKENIQGIYLSYFGTADPHYYGIKYKPVAFYDLLSPPWISGHRDGDKLDFDSMQKVYLAVSATNLQSTYYTEKNIFSWLKDVKPVKIIAHSIFVYDITGNRFLLGRLKLLLDSINEEVGQ